MFLHLQKMNKRGSDKILSIYWFVVLTLIAGGIVLMVNSFYSSPYDVRELEAEILSMKVANCILHGGQMDPRLFSSGSPRSEFRDNFLERCDLNFDPKIDLEEIQYYVGIDFYRGVDGSDDPLFSIEGGNNKWVEDCEIEANKNKLGVCHEETFFGVDNGGAFYKVELLTIVGNVNENVK